MPGNPRNKVSGHDHSCEFEIERMLLELQERATWSNDCMIPLSFSLCHHASGNPCFSGNFVTFVTFQAGSQCDVAHFLFWCQSYLLLVGVEVDALYQAGAIVRCTILLIVSASMTDNYSVMSSYPQQCVWVGKPRLSAGKTWLIHTCAGAADNIRVVLSLIWGLRIYTSFTSVPSGDRSFFSFDLGVF